MKKIKAFNILIITLIIATVFTGCELDTKKIKDSNIKQSIWIWNSSHINSIKIIDDLYDMNINEIYINTGWDKETNKFYLESHPNIYASFIDNANDYNIRVQALLSNSDWIFEENYNDFEIQINTILNYNSKYRKKFDAIHLDIEPHTLPNWDENKTKYLELYLKCLQKINVVIDNHNKSTNDDLKLVLDIPFWYCQKEFNIDSKNLTTQLSTISDELVIMNYTKNQSDFIERGVENLKLLDNLSNLVTIGVEFQEEYSDVSICNKSPQELLEYIENSLNEFKNYKSFKGFAIHDYDSYVKYLEKNNAIKNNPK